MEPEIVYTTLTPNKGTTPVAMQNGNVLDNNNVDNNNKGKAIQLGSFSDDEQEENESSPGSSPLSSNSLLDPDSLIYEDDSDQYGYEMDMEEDQEADDYVSEYQALFDAKEKELPAGVEATSLHVRNTNLLEPQPPVPAPASSSSVLLPTQNKKKGIYNARPGVQEVISAPTTCRVKRNMDDYLGKFVFFKRFDIVEDLVDHQYASKGTASKKHTKEWAKRIQEEWRILENDLPEMIFVRAYESRMDLLRAVIIGADGTPYHDGLFFFDIFFPDTYPSVPPVVHYHSGGLGINPNLYGCGKVCLSLLGTWSGSSKEKWLPNKLQCYRFLSQSKA
ncbi:hypothetical protein F2Q68_00003013 [Brassica cretica]|uniref:UBC core domain-containing protein n=1 Tax=Brassica cretica TaxID=69181 RepID=A0A8S9JAN7_BRACR|nr:hypothetical protein F2Q68_00003013 [Brassica cretica]